MLGLIDPADCATRTAVFRMIPDVKLKLAKDAFEDFVWMASQHLAGATVVPWTDQHHFPDLTPDDLTDLISGPSHITPKGARLLKRLVQRGLIPRHEGAEPPDLSALDAYIASEPELIQRTAERRARRRRHLQDKAKGKAEARAAFAARIAHLAEHPEDARPQEVTREVINALFLHKFGEGVGGMIVLAGLQCFKGCPPSGRSISGRSWRNLETIYWLDAEGVRHGDMAVRVRTPVYP